MKDLLKKLNACQEAIEWVGDKIWEECYNTCERGDWLLWLFVKTNPDDLQRLTLAKGHCANTVRHLMTDERSIKAVDISIAFGEGKATKEELDTAANAAAYASYANAAANAAASSDAASDAAYYAASSDAAYYAAADAAYYAAADAANAAAGAANAAYAAAYTSAAANADYTASAARKTNQQLTAEICRKYLPIEIWNI